MTLQEQLKKVETDLKKVEGKRKSLQEKRHKILAEIRAEKNQKIIDIISENFGEITDENIEQFRKIISEKTGDQKPNNGQGDGSVW